MVNFDPQILTLMRETQYMNQLGFDIPPAAKDLMSRQAELMKLYQSVTVRFRRISLTRQGTRVDATTDDGHP